MALLTAPATGGQSWVKDLIVRVSPDGTLRLLAGGGTSLADGPAAKAQIAVDWRGGGLVWSPKDRCLYFVHPMVPAVRRLYQKDGQWFVETAAGDPQQAGKDDVLYLADHWHYAARRIGLRAMTASTVAVSENNDNPKAGNSGRPAHAGGPAPTHATFNSGVAYVCYDPVHKALWVGGPDEHRMRWVRDGWVKTVTGYAMGPWPADGTGTPAAKPRFNWGNVAAVDPQGRAYITTPDGGVWRAYNAKEVKP